MYQQMYNELQTENIKLIGTGVFSSYYYILYLFMIFFCYVRLLLLLSLLYAGRFGIAYDCSYSVIH